MQIADEINCGESPALSLRLNLQPIAEAAPIALRQFRSLFCGGMHADQMIDRGAGCRLTTFVQPQAGQHGGKIRPLQPRTKAPSLVDDIVQAEVPNT